MKELIEKKNDLITRAEDVLNKAKAEERALEDSEIEQINEINDEVKRINKTLEAHEEMEKLEGGDLEMEEERVEEQVEERALNEEKEFEGYVRGLVLNERANNMTFTDNGAVIPRTIADKIIKRVYDICPILERSTKYNVKGTLDIPYYDESTTAMTVAYVEEFSELESNVGKFETITLSGHLAGVLSLISKSLINNSQFNIVDFVVNEMAEKVARFIENELLNGTTGKVEGLSGATNLLTAGSATAITADELIEVQGKVKDVHQANAIWIMSPETRTAIRQLKDRNERYLLQDDITSPFGVSLLGKPVYVSDNMSNIESGKVAVFYGDMSGLATKFAEELSVQVLREKYATQHAVGVVGYIEFDGKVEDQSKLAGLKMA